MRNQELVKNAPLEMHHHHKDSTVLTSFSDCSTTSIKEQHYQLKISRTEHAEGIRNTDIPPKGAGTLEDAGCVCAVAATGTVPKALLKIMHTFSDIRIASLTIIYNLQSLLAHRTE